MRGCGTRRRRGPHRGRAVFASTELNSRAWLPVAVTGYGTMTDAEAQPRSTVMPQPGSRAYDSQKHHLEKDLEDRGVDDTTAEQVASDAMKEKAATGDDKVRPDLPPEASPSANPPGQKNRKS